MGIDDHGITPCHCREPCSAATGRIRTILVEVLPNGFRYENRHYASLSAIALAVTDTRWNGLAFFGLTGKAAAMRKEPARA